MEVVLVYFADDDEVAATRSIDGVVLLNALFATGIKLVQRFDQTFCLQIEDRGMSLVSKSQI